MTDGGRGRDGWSSMAASERDDAHRSSGHRRRKKSKLRIWKHKFKEALRRRFWVIPATVIAIAVVGVSAWWLLSGVRDINHQSLQAETQQNVGSGYRDIVYKGKPYRYNSRITTVLYAGVDSRGELKQNDGYLNGGMADSISLAVIDEFHHKLTIIAINRYTITKVHRYTMGGRDRGTFNDWICYAYYYGDGGKASCQNLCQAVSDLLYGIPINNYVVTNLSSLTLMSDIIGDVVVTVPNEDLADLGYHKGQQIVVNADNMDTFLHSRDVNVEFSNDGRMERQRAYINGAMTHIRSMVEEDTLNTWESVKRLEDVMQTNITRNKYLDLAKALKRTDYGEQNYYVPEGDNIVGRIYEEFYPDEDALLSKIIELFYIEK